MSVHNRILVDNEEKAAIGRGLTTLFEGDHARWTVTIRPSRVEPRWTIEVSAPGRYWACTAGAGEQDAASIVSLVRAAVGESLRGPAPQSQE